MTAKQRRALAFVAERETVRSRDARELERRLPTSTPGLSQIYRNLARQGLVDVHGPTVMDCTITEAGRRAAEE